MTKRAAMLLAALALQAAPGVPLAADIPAGPQTRATLRIIDSLTALTTGQFEAKGDKDWYKVRLARNADYTFVVDNIPDQHIQLNVRDSAGKLLAGHYFNNERGGHEFRAPKAGTYYVEIIHAEPPTVPQAYRLGATNDCRGDEKTRCKFQVGKSRKGLLSYVFDVDNVKGTLEASATYRVSVSSRVPDIYVFIYDDKLEQLNNGGSETIFTAPRTGIYYLSITNFSGTNNPATFSPAASSTLSVARTGRPAP